MAKPWAYLAAAIKNHTTVEECRDKGSGFKLPRVANCGEVDTWGETNGIQFVFRFLWCCLWANKSLELSPGKEILYPRKGEGKESFSCICYFKKNFFFLVLIDFIYLFIFGCVESSVTVRGLSLVAASRGYSSLRCEGFSLRWLLLLPSTGSRRAGFSSCGTWASVVVACGLSRCASRAQ